MAIDSLHQFILFGQKRFATQTWQRLNRRNTAGQDSSKISLLAEDWMGLVACGGPLDCGNSFQCQCGWLAEQALAPFLCTTSIRSLAVLPLINMSGDPEQEYFVDGMTDELSRAFAHQFAQGHLTNLGYAVQRAKEQVIIRDWTRT